MRNRFFTHGCFSLVCLGIIVSLGTVSSYAQEKPSTGQGIMLGELTDRSVVIQVRLTDGNTLIKGDLPGTGGVVKFKIFPVQGNGKNNSKNKIELGSRAKPQFDFIARVAVNDLRPNQEYLCTTTILKSGQTWEGPSAKFKTLPGGESSAAVKFVVVTGMNYAKFHGDQRIDKKKHLIQNNTKLPKPYQGEDKKLGYPALKTILNLKPDFFVGTGDNVYYDSPHYQRAKTVKELRKKWHEQFVQQRYLDLFAHVPTYWMIDDHDYRVDDSDNTGDYEPGPAVGHRLMLEQLPYAAHEAKEPKTYRTVRINKDLQLWFVENRLYRSPNKSPDGPEKTIWGKEQKEWLKKTLLASDATFKLLISPTPMVGPDDLRKTDNHTNLKGFQHERDEFFSWLKETGIDKKNFYLVCGDRHWQYHALDSSGIEEFSCGALVDANSRLGRKPGDPQSTDPQGKIKQIYTQKERSGGFLEISTEPASQSNPAKLKFNFRDEKGELLYSHEKSGSHKK